MNSVAAGPGRPAAIYAGATVAAQGTDFSRGDMIGRELIPPREEPGLGYAETVGGTRYVFADLKTLLARATPPRSGDRLAGLEAADMTERVAAQLALADLPLRCLIEDPVLPYETDEITRLIIDSHDRDAFVPIAAMNVGELRDWLLSRMPSTPRLSPT
jgi:ethanolamine ammonia-lyase large subunit